MWASTVKCTEEVKTSSFRWGAYYKKSYQNSENVNTGKYLYSCPIFKPTTVELLSTVYEDCGRQVIGIICLESWCELRLLWLALVLSAACTFTAYAHCRLGDRPRPYKRTLHLPSGCAYIIWTPPVTRASVATAENEHVWFTSELRRQNSEPKATDTRRYCLTDHGPHVKKTKQMTAVTMTTPEDPVAEDLDLGCWPLR